MRLRGGTIELCGLDLPAKARDHDSRSAGTSLRLSASPRSMPVSRRGQLAGDALSATVTTPAHPTLPTVPTIRPPCTVLESAVPSVATARIRLPSSRPTNLIEDPGFPAS